MIALRAEHQHGPFLVGEVQNLGRQLGIAFEHVGAEDDHALGPVDVIGQATAQHRQVVERDDLGLVADDLDPVRIRVGIAQHQLRL